MPSPGDLIGGRYRLMRLIGEGGMGTVFEARHEVLGSIVALKFLNPELTKRPGLVARFLQEARVSATIQSPHVTRVTDVEQSPDGSAYLVMELLSGESLQQRLDRTGALPRQDALDLSVQILAGLEAAHAVGVVHRDLKPDNVFITPSPAGPMVKLLDFGIAKLKESSEFQQSLTGPGTMMGTPEYMAPEQALSADQVDARADLYSFGIILYEMLTGRRPVESDDPSEILETVIRGGGTRIAERDPSLPPRLAVLVDQTTSSNPADRPESARYLRQQLIPFATSLSPVGQRAAEFSDTVAVPSRASGTQLTPRHSSVPKTLPPEDDSVQGVPASVVAGARISTARMRQFESPDRPTPTAPPDVRGYPDPLAGHWAPATGRRRSRAGLWLLLSLLVATGATAGVWLYFNPSVLSDTRPPPLPGPAPISSPLPELEDPSLSDLGLDEGSRSSSSRKRPPTRPTTPGTPPPEFKIPPIVLPSQLPPLPSSLPTSLPPGFPRIPGFPGSTSQPAAPTAPSAGKASPQPSTTP